MVDPMIQEMVMLETIDGNVELILNVVRYTGSKSSLSDPVSLHYSAQHTILTTIQLN